MAYTVGNVTCTYELNGIKIPVQIDSATITNNISVNIVYPASATSPESRGIGLEEMSASTPDEVNVVCTNFDVDLGITLQNQITDISKRATFARRRGTLTITSIEDTTQQIILSECVPDGNSILPSIEETAGGKWTVTFKGNLIKEFTGYVNSR